MSTAATDHLKMIRLGLSLTLIGIFLILLAVLMAVLLPLGGDAGLATSLPLLYAVAGTAIGGTLLGLLGRLLCLSSPEPETGRGAIFVAAGCDVLAVLLSAALLFMEVPAIMQNVQQFLGLVGLVAFVIYLRELGSFLDRLDLARDADGLLKLGVGMVILLGLIIVSLLLLPLAAFVLVLSLLVIGIVWFVRYVGLLVALKNAPHPSRSDVGSSFSLGYPEDLPEA